MSENASKGNAAGNYEPISCLPLRWKLLSKRIAGEQNRFCDENDMLLTGPKGCGRRFRGIEDTLLTGKMVM